MTVRLTVQVQLVLQALLRDPAGEMNGLELSEETGLQPGSAYPILLRLEHEGWVTSRWEDIDPRAEKRPARRYYRLTAGGAATASSAVSESHFGAWHWVPWVLGFTAITVFTAIAMAASGGRPGGRGRGSGLGGRGRDDDDGPAGAAAHRWRMLVMVSRLMPRSAGCRWLAEAESLLPEIAAARRGAAFRSYLLSAPRLVMMWTREVLRRARLGPRHPG